MSVTIDSLDIQIRSSAGSAADNIDKLADSLVRLQQNAKLTVVTNNLTKLSNALDQIQTKSASLSAINGLVGAMKSLSSIEKPSGLNSTLNSLKKLPEVIAGLDTATLDQFSAKMRELSSALAPLSNEIATVSNAFSKLPKRVRDMVSGVNKLKTATDKATKSQQKHNDSLDKQGINLMAAIHNIQSYMGALQAVGQHISTLMADAIEWDGIQFRFGRAFGEDAEEVYAYAQKINDVLGINLQQFMQYSSLYGSLLSGFGMAQEKVTTISVGLTELSYDIWAAYNDRFKTLEQASEAVRSAITGEIEPIRNAGIALTEASLQEYIDSTHLAGVSIEKLSEAQKAEVRYAAMVNAAMQQGIVGTYAKEMDTAEGAVRNLTQQLKTLGQALGSIFLPVLQVVVPWLTAFVELIYEGAVAFMALLGIPFQEIKWDSASSGVGGLADSANEATDALGGAAKQAKKLKDYTMGFDELNVINPNSGSAGSGGAGGTNGSGWGTGLELDTLWDESLFANASKKVDELKVKIKEWFDEWKEEIAIVSAALAIMGVAKLISNLSTVLGQMSNISKFSTMAVVITLQYSIMSELLENFIEEGEWEDYIKAAAVGALGAFASYAMWGKKGLIVSLGVTAAVSLKATFEDGSVDSTEEAVTGVTGLATGLLTLRMAWKALWPVVKGSKIFQELAIGFALLKENGIGFVLSSLFPKLSAVVSAAATWVTGTLVPGIVSALGALASALGISIGAAAALVAGVIVAAIVATILIVKYWDEIKFFFTDTLPKWFSGAWAKIKEIWGIVADWFDEKVIQPIVKFFKPIVAWISEFFRGCWMIVRAVWVVVSTWFKDNVIDPLVNFFKGVWVSVSGFFSQLWEDIKNVWDIVSSWFNNTVVKPVVKWFKSVWTKVKAYFENLWNNVKEVWAPVSSWFNTKVIEPLTGFFSTAWTNIKEAFVTAFNGIRTFAVKIINGLIGGVESMINRVIDGINGLVGGFNKVVTWAADILGEDWGGLTILKRVELPRIQIEAKANGGFVNSGQMFVAREAGPELVGSIGSRTAVANNDQIVEGIAAGVYRAVVSAMNDVSGQQNQNVNVYLDGKQIYASVKKTEAQRGRTLMGNQLGYSY